MRIAESSVLVTGADRGTGRALVAEALRRGAQRVYAGTRRPLGFADARVTPLGLDVTDRVQVRLAAESVPSLDLLVNTAGTSPHDQADDHRRALEQHLAVNLFGTYDVTEAFLPLLLESRGAVVNVLSTAALAAVPSIPAHSISKAAALSMTQSLRALVAGRGVGVHAVLSGPVDTERARDLHVPRASPEAVARAILDGVEAGEDDIFPDPGSRAIVERWRSGPGTPRERRDAVPVRSTALAS